MSGWRATARVVSSRATARSSNDRRTARSTRANEESTVRPNHHISAAHPATMIDTPPTSAILATRRTWSKVLVMVPV